MRFRNIRNWSLNRALLLALILASGCGEERPVRVPVSGQVLVDGQPLKHGVVRFIPSGARMSQGVLDENGRFTLSCFENGDGAVIGRHEVLVQGSEQLNSVTTRWHAPRKYADPHTSELTELIDRPTESLVINLTWNGGKPFDETNEGAKDVRRSGQKN